jgi:hypothetical protein
MAARRALSLRYLSGDTLQRILEGGIELIGSPEGTFRVKGLGQFSVAHTLGQLSSSQPLVSFSMKARHLPSSYSGFILLTYSRI